MELYWAGADHTGVILWGILRYARDREGGEA